VPAADVGGVSLYYEERGTGRPVVFVHGIPTDFRAWNAQMRVFGDGRRAIAYSRRYASPNQREGDVSDSTINNNALDLKGFIEEVAGGKADVIGHSYGGFIAAVLAADHPDVVGSLVLVEPAISTMLVADQASGAQLLKLLFSSPGVALSGRRFQNESLKPSLQALKDKNPERATELNVDGVQGLRGAYGSLPEDVRKMMLDNARTIGELGTPFPRFTAKEAGRISSPSLVVNGESGALFLRRIGALVARAIPGSKSAVVRGSRHFPHFENPDEFNKIVSGFLGETSGP